MDPTVGGRRTKNRAMIRVVDRTSNSSAGVGCTFKKVDENMMVPSDRESDDTWPSCDDYGPVSK